MINPIKNPIGILGGTFDPVHLGHLHIAKLIQKDLQLEEVCFIPCKQPLLKQGSQATTEQRLDMLKIACEPFPQFTIDERELRRDSPSYMVDTLTSFREELPNTPLCLIMGFDVFLELPKWHEWHKLIQLAHLIVVNRGNTKDIDDPDLKAFYDRHRSQPSHHFKTRSGTINFIQTSPLPYSSREIRRKIKNNEDVSDQLPRGVWQYIKNHQLYQNL